MKQFALLLILVIGISCEQKKNYDFIIRNATIVDGSGAPGYKGDVAINGDTIAAVGTIANATGKTEMDANGMTLAPGFIDSHSHHDWSMQDNREMIAVTSQGVTTIVVGQDGFSHFPLSDFFKTLDETPVAVNIASYSGHNTLRDSVIAGAYNRFCTPEEIEIMKQMLKQDMDAGAIGISTGLEYDPGIFSEPSEVLELSKIASQNGGRYISHIRSEDRTFWKALDEIITIGKEANMPVQVSHAKLAMKSLWGQSEKLLKKLDSARAAGVNITADIYPYAFWHSTLTVVFPERNFKDKKAAQFALTELTTPEGMLISEFSPNPEYVGKTLAEISVIRKTDPAQTLMDLIAITEKDKGSSEGIIATSMDEADISAIIKWPYSNICSDGASTGLHPRGRGSFPKILRKYVREDHLLSLEEAVYKMTSLTAKNLNIPKRGLLQPGFYSDMVLFDPATVSDNSTPKDPQALASGILKVWVNGKEVCNNSVATTNYPGKAIKRK